MVQMENGTRVYQPGEWNASKRSSAVYHARKFGGNPTTKVIAGVLIVWPAVVDWARKGEDCAYISQLAGEVR